MSSQPKPVPSEHVYFKIGHLYQSVKYDTTYTTQPCLPNSWEAYISQGTIFMVCEFVHSEHIDIKWARVIFQDNIGWIRVWNDEGARESFPEVSEEAND